MRICLEKVREFTAATGADADRWVEAAPPGFISTALFVVAPDLLSQLEGYSVIHGDQSFFWNGPLGMEQDVAVTGTVSRVRDRNETTFVTFDLLINDGDGGELAGGTSLFLISDAGQAETGQMGSAPPAADDRGSPRSGQRSASRADLVRYAAATRDWNPIHWDHDAAGRAGLGGVIAHGLLQASWALDAACGDVHGLEPARNAKVRFRNPLPPATPVDVDVQVDGDTKEVTLSSGETVFVSARVEVVDE